MSLTFNMLLAAEGINPSDVRLLRHQTDKSAGRTPYTVLKAKACRAPNRQLSQAVDLGISGIYFALANKPNSFGGAIKNAASAGAVLRGALALYGAEKKKAAIALVNLMKSSAVFDRALEELVSGHFNISGWTLPN